jgi:hypothetical protein
MALLQATLALFTAEKGGAYGSQRNQEMRTSGLYVSGHFGEVLQPAVRGDGRNPGRGLQVPSLGLQGQNGIRGPRIVIEDALRASVRRKSRHGFRRQRVQLAHLGRAAKFGFALLGQELLKLSWELREYVSEEQSFLCLLVHEDPKLQSESGITKMPADGRLALLDLIASQIS